MNDYITSETIDHIGTVKYADDDSVTVTISPDSSCAGCHAAGSCLIPGKEEKLIKVHGSYAVKPGDRVTVMMKKSMGFSAVILGYLLPFCILTVTLVVLVSLQVNELLAGLVSISVLVPYFLILFFVRKRINRQFTFELKL